MLTAIILLATVPGWSRAQDGEVLLPDNKTQCAMDMVQWCNKMQYPEEGAGLTMESITYEDPAGLYKVFCASDSDGTVCTKNEFSWFSCTPNKVPPGNTLTYKGQILFENMSTAIISKLDDICVDADRAFNDLFVQNLSYQNETLKKEVQQTFEMMFQEMSDMKDQMETMQDQLNLFTLFFKDYIMGRGNESPMPLQNQNEATTLPPSNSTAFNSTTLDSTILNSTTLNTTEQVNEIQLD